MNKKDEVRLRDMLDAARKGVSFSDGKTREMLDEDDMFAFALIKAIEIVGEAASRITTETRETYTQIAWKGIIGMRNKTVHDYLSVDHDLVWETATTRLPELISQLEAILPLQND